MTLERGFLRGYSVMFADQNFFAVHLSPGLENFDGLGQATD
jgi:hypothetical protein